ncbi:hypothetical protein OBRU01_15368 [Operophtera brumata]|uniref:Uncharacterized protein n=1 Tax=Operophtera brumata TaxID=104452 RepID=A0A0L7KXQ4_OPEBR|nr:hypothetical protein OBRU01_15368 [Operophtera brumata]
MSRQIKYLQLTKPELTYEVRIRADEPKDTVEDLRKQIVKLATKFPAEDILDSCYEITEDTIGIRHTLAKTAINLDSLKEDPQQKGLLERTHTYLNHVYHRLNRIPPTETVEQLSLVKETQEFYREQWSKLQEILASLGRNDQASRVDTIVDDTKITCEASVDTQPAPCNLAHNVKVSCDRLTSDISKIKYDGKSCVRSFIARVEEFRIAKDITGGKMLKLATEIFSENAHHWYCSVKETIVSWSGLLELLKEDFDIVDYDYRMLSEIRNRSQGPSEAITIYLAIIHGMFTKLSKKLSEQEQLEIFLHNIRPCYSSVLATFSSVTSIANLRSLCKNYEQIKARSDDFKEPPTVSSNTLAPEYAYQANKDAKTSSNHTNQRPISNRPYGVAAVRNDVFCYRCRVNTHTMRQCTAERTIKCFRCGLKDYRTPECPKCNPKIKQNCCNDKYDISDWNNWLSTIRRFFSTYKVATILNTKPTNDPRPYIKISIGNIPNLSLFGLLDSGSAVTILGRGTHVPLTKFGLNLFTDEKINVTAAGGERLASLGYILLPVVFENITHVLKAYVIPAIGSGLILENDLPTEIIFLPRDAYAESLGHLSGIFDKVQAALWHSHQKNSMRYNTRRKQLEFNTGDIIWKRCYLQSDKDAYFSKKLAPKYQKCRIKAKRSSLVYILEDMCGRDLGAWHVKDFKPHKS